MAASAQGPGPCRHRRASSWVSLCRRTRRCAPRGVRIVKDDLGGVAQPLRLRQRLELLERVVLDLADALARDVEGLADLLQRARALAGEPVAHLDHLALA